jgi:P-type Ca2+ transporter type 2C
MDYYKKEVDEVLKEFETSENGLTSGEAKKRLDEHGPNKISQEMKFNLLKLFFSQFHDLLIIILIVAGAISFIVGAKSDSIVIFMIVLLNTLIGFIQEYKTERSLQALQKLVSKSTVVVRNSTHVEIALEDVVPGDILVLEEGMKVPADARVIKNTYLATDESTLTGESIVKHKAIHAISKGSSIADQNNMVFMGTMISAGSCLAVVVATGMNAEFGKIAKLTSEQGREDSPLQKELNTVAKKVAEFAIVISIIIFVVGVLQKPPDQSYIGIMYTMFLYAISLAVAVVPEGLPATVTIALAIGVQKLLKKNAIVKQLSSVETLGCTMVICTDKTGTLTKNQMTVKEIFVDGKHIEVTGDGYSSKGLIQDTAKTYENLIRIGKLCNNSSMTKSREFIGDPTEIALRVLAEKADFDEHHMKNRYIRTFEKPFDSDRKMMSVVCEVDGKKAYSFTKGGPRQILEKCTYVLVKGKKVKITKAVMDRLLNVNRRMADKALRVLACAYKDLPKKFKHETIEEGMTFAGFIGMLDPPREGVLESLQKCTTAGIDVMMITGDQPSTALAIAKKIGLVHETSGREVLLTGAELEKLDDSKLENSLKDIRVFARVSPEQKIKIVSALQRIGKVTAMTGDGVNDAPALKKADIGVAMGSGTDVSKEASNMILLDDSFTTIVEAIKFGRGIYENIKKFILYVFSGIGTELLVVLASMFSPLPLAITAVQILWIDLGTEVLPALALSVDPVEDSIMQEKPRSKDKHILDLHMIGRIFRLVIWKAPVLLIMFVWALNKYGLPKAQTLIFTTLIMFQMFNVFNCRDSLKSVFHPGTKFNKYLFGAVIISTVLQVGVVHLPLGNTLFGTVPLAWFEWCLVVGVAGTIIPYMEISKVIRRKFLSYRS